MNEDIQFLFALKQQVHTSISFSIGLLDDDLTIKRATTTEIRKTFPILRTIFYEFGDFKSSQFVFQSCCFYYGYIWVPLSVELLEFG